MKVIDQTINAMQRKTGVRPAENRVPKRAPNAMCKWCTFPAEKQITVLFEARAQSGRIFVQCRFEEQRVIGS